MSDRWEEIRIWVVKRLRDGDVNLTNLAAQANVNYWWLNSLRLGNTMEPGWRKMGRVYEALGGRPPKCPAPLNAKGKGQTPQAAVPLDPLVGQKGE